MSRQRLVCLFTLDGKIHYQDTSGFGWSEDEEDVFLIFIHGGRGAGPREFGRTLSKTLREAQVEWIVGDGDVWFFDADAFRRALPEFELLPWVRGRFPVRVERVEEYKSFPTGEFEKPRRDLYGRIEILPSDVLSGAQSIFLSHKTADKPRIRLYYDALITCGLSPWMDERDLHAGSHLERSLYDAFQKSCAAVFFLSEHYIDENYLAAEVDYAIQRKREIQDNFSIITLRYSDADGRKPEIPRLLKSYVWKDVNNDLLGLTEIIKALPFSLSFSGWK